MGSLVSAVSEELGDGGNPARNRAVSLAVAASELRAGAALSTSTAIRTAATALFQAAVCAKSQEETSGALRHFMVDLPPTSV